MSRASGGTSALVPLAVLGLIDGAVCGLVAGIAGSREAQFRREATPVTVAVLTAGPAADRTSNQKLTVRTPASAPGGARTYERTLVLRQHDDASPPRPIRPGALLPAYVSRDDPADLRLVHDAADSADFFRFQAFFGLAAAAGCSVLALLRALLLRWASALRRRFRS